MKFPLKKILIKSPSHFQKEFPLNLLQDPYILCTTNNINFRMPILGKADATAWEDIKVCRMHIAQKSGIFWTIFSLWEFALQTNFTLTTVRIELLELVQLVEVLNKTETFQNIFIVSINDFGSTDSIFATVVQLLFSAC